MGWPKLWNAGCDFRRPFAINIDFLINLAQQFSNLQFNAENTFMTGMSNGAELCYLIACEAPGFFKAFAPGMNNFPNGLTNNSCTNFSVPFLKFMGVMMM